MKSVSRPEHGRRGRLRAVPLALACVAMACRGSEPRVHTAATVAGDWVMVERDGKRLPSTERRTWPGSLGTCTSTLIRSVLSLRADGSWSEETEARAWCDGVPAPDTSMVEHNAGRFQLRGLHGDTINLFPQGADSTSRQKGVIAGDELRLEFTLLKPDTVTIRYRYERVRDR